MKKFRAWDAIKKEFRDYDGWLIDPENGLILDSFLNHEDDYFEEKVSLIVEQYIGLNDSISQEIYEGDIVRIYDNRTGRTFTGEVMFKNASFCIESDIAIHYRWIDYVITKLGNKHEDTQIILREGL